MLKSVVLTRASQGSESPIVSVAYSCFRLEDMQVDRGGVSFFLSAFGPGPVWKPNRDVEFYRTFDFSRGPFRGGDCPIRWATDFEDIARCPCSRLWSSIVWAAVCYFVILALVVRLTGSLAGFPHLPFLLQRSESVRRYCVAPLASSYPFYPLIDPLASYNFNYCCL